MKADGSRPAFPGRAFARKGRKGRRGLRDEGVKGATEGFWMFNFSPRSRDALTRGCWIVKKCECSFEENVADLAGKGVKKVTIKVYIPWIYIVNISMQSKYYKI